MTRPPTGDRAGVGLVSFPEPQRARFEYNALGKVTRETDPLGRTTIYNYDATGIDLVEVRQVNGQTTDLLKSLTYNSQHEPLSVTDAAGQTTILTHNGQGQVATVVTPPRDGLTQAQRTTSYLYDANGYLQSEAGPATGATTTYSYDGYGRVQTRTDSDNYTRTYDYDALDRVTKLTYPDGTHDQAVYGRLDAEQHRDRLGRWSRTFYDALRRPTATRDAEGRTLTQVWCNCGSLDKLIDANGNSTIWERDLQSRVIKETRANSSFKEFTYQATTSRLKKVKDAKNQEINYSYFLDDKVQQISYTNAQITTPTVSFTYDVSQGRLASITDGTGTRIYSYYPITVPSSLGAGMVASVDGPLSNDTLTYSYDALGRTAGRTLNGVTTAWAYDLLGRLTTLTDPIGVFTYTYAGTTARPSSVTYPNGQTTTYAYLSNALDKRLQEIHHKKPDATTLSRFTYTYDAIGNIKGWTQQSGTSAPNVYEFGYDQVDELVSAVYRTTDPAPVVLKRYAYTYDFAGNRTAEQIDDAVTGATYDNMNRLTSQQPGGALLFKGTTSEPATVTVAGKPATTTASNQFTGSAQVPTGTGPVAVQATDPAGNVRTNTYQVTQSGASRAYSYDANGNLTADGTKTYEWDAENHLVAVKQGATTIAATSYDGSGRRVTRTAAGVTTTYIYDGPHLLEMRLSSGSTKRFVQSRAVDHLLAEVSGGVASYLVADNLGSLTERTDSAGSQTLQQRYDPWGRFLSASAGGYAFTGREWEPDTGLYYYRARDYDPETGRFLSEDPIGLEDGPNRYAYVGGNPINKRDPFGTEGRPNMNTTEIRYCARRPELCAWNAPCYFAAQTLERQLNNGRRGDDDRNNALKHCSWSCCIAQRSGNQVAIEITDNHEDTQQWSNPCSSQMDKHNNGLGGALGSANPNKDCLIMCKTTPALQCTRRRPPDYRCSIGM